MPTGPLSVVGAMLPVTSISALMGPALRVRWLAIHSIG
jgi:hypothetical protein